MNFKFPIQWITVSTLIISGSVVMVGWFIPSVAITQIYPDFAAMQFNTALCFVLAGLSILFLNTNKIIASKITTSLLALISILSVNNMMPGGMSGITASVFILSSIALYVANSSCLKKGCFAFLDYSSLFIFGIGSISILGYLLDLNLASIWQVYIQVALPTAIGFCLLAVALLSISPLKSQLKLQIHTSLTVLTFIVLSPLLVSSQIELTFLGILFALFLFNRESLVNSLMKLKDREENLKKTTEFLEQTGQMAKVGGWELDLSNGKVHLSKETQRIHEIDHNYIPPLYDTGDQWYPPDAWPTIKAAVEKAISQSIPYDLELPFITAKGKNIWVRVQGYPVKKDNKVTHLRGTFQDITEQKVKVFEDNFIKDAMGFGFWIFNPLSGELQWDDRMYALYGLNAKDFSGAYSAWENSLSPKAKNEAVKELELALKGEKDFNTEFEIKLKSGESRFIAGRGIVIRNEQKQPIKMYGVNWDVTNRVESEQDLKVANLKVIQSSKLASLGEMSAGIAHEINNPLAIILGSLNLLSKYKDDPEKFKAKVESIRKSSEKISRIINGLKKFSRTSDKVIHEPHKMIDIANEVMILVESKAKNVSTSVTIECSTSAYILCNEIEIEQVLVNLINNAIDATAILSQKWVKISIFEDENSVVIQVMDSGLGIPKDIQNKLFDPFFTTKEIGEGTGLGLSITKGILEEHKASISLKTDSTNTCFEVRFPRALELKKAI